MPLATINGIQMYYEIHGSGPTVVLSHGLGSTHMHWWRQVSFLSGRFRVITFDHRGFGFSSDDGRGCSEFVEDLMGLLDYLDVEVAIIVGQSMGAFSAAGVAARHPNRVRALVLSSSSAGLVAPRPPTQFVRDNLATVTDYRSLAHILIHQDGFPRRQPALCFLCEQMAQLNHKVDISILSQLSKIRHDASPLREASIPILLLGGDEDEGTVDAMKEIASQLPSAVLKIVPGTGHLLFFEDPESYNASLDSFLAPIIGAPFRSLLG